MCVSVSVSTAWGCILIRAFYHFSRKVLSQHPPYTEQWREAVKAGAEAAQSTSKVAISQLSQHQSSKYGLDHSNRLTNITVQSSFHLELLNKGNNTHTETHIYSQTICDYSFMCIMLGNVPPPFLHRQHQQQHARTYIALHSLTRSVSLSKRKFSISTFYRNELMMILNRNTLFE